MAFIRACSYSCSITPPKDPTTYTDVLVTIAQDGENVINKNLTGLEISGSDFILKLTQQETAYFVAGKRAWLQIRCYISDDDVEGNSPWPIEVFPALNDMILGTE